ncbi:MAG: hypothetical protein U1A27_02875 [Phycisphaerae bacterium]
MTDTHGPISTLVQDACTQWGSLLVTLPIFGAVLTQVINAFCSMFLSVLGPLSL